MKLKMHNDYILVEPCTDVKKASIILPKSVSDNKFYLHGIIVDSSTEVKPGQRVLFRNYRAGSVKVGGRDLLLIKADDIVWSENETS